jgi:F-type H+-transporting ATPase subunit b
MHPEPGFFAEPRNWVVIAFFLFFILFGKKLWGALAGILDARGVDALAEAKALIEGAAAEAKRLAAAAAAEAEASAKRREQMAVERIAAAEKAAVDDVRVAAADVATAAARQVLAEGLTADADARLIDQAITQLPAALAPRRAA